MELIQSKSLLAKLMATENLTVEQRNVSTASFDVQSRVLTLPVLDSNISGSLYDLLTGHEVGHALWTPVELLQQGMDLKIPRSVLNVIEDVRIERKIKNKYPGIRISFVKGYRELLEKDFFGTNGLDLNGFNFIDRTNLFYKGGVTLGIKFNDYENELLNDIESTETPADVLKVSLKVMEYLKQEKEEREKQNPVPPEEDGENEELYGDDDFTPEDYGDLEESDETEEEGRDKSKDSQDGEDGETGEDESEQSDSEESDDEEGQQDSGGMEGSDELKSHTDEKYRQNENKLFENKGSNYYYGNVPNVDIKNVVVPHKELWTRFATDLEKLHNLYPNYRTTQTERNLIGEYQKVREDTKKVVSYLAKEFEMKKNAEQLKRASIAKTGDLNMNKIYSYKFSDDIFKKMSVIPNGKSHGLVMFLDWSGSMTDHLTNTVKQLINLVMFCKKVNIPYEVYAFSSEYDDTYQHTPIVGDLQLSNFKLLNLLSNRMSAKEFTYACSHLISIAKGSFMKPSWFCLGGTPLSESIIAAMKIVPEFQKANKLQIVNTVFLTDGQGNTCDAVYRKDSHDRIIAGYSEGAGRWNSKLIVRDPLTKMQEIAEHVTKVDIALIKLLKYRTGSNILGFYVLSGRDFGKSIRQFFPRGIDENKIRADFRKNKFQIVTSLGYDEYYLLRSESMNTEEDVEFEVKENATTRGLVSAFSKYAGNRLSNRVVLNRFIDMIS